MTLKANELMIGDLLTTKKAPDILLKVISVEYSVNLQKYIIWGKTLDGTIIGPFFEEEMIPIPFSPEIPEKNGWVKHTSIDDEDDVFYKRDDSRLCLTFNEDKDTLYVADRIMDQYITFCTLTFIHELQHAFRLCGLNDLAENFKI